MNKDFGTIAIRALNSCRMVYLPSYIGLRLFLHSLSNLDIGGGIIARMLQFNTSWRYNQFQVFKNFNEDGNPQYRTFTIGSPSTCLCESIILRYLSEQNAFRTHPCVYSYLWPKNEKSGRNHSFFLKGYQNRNEKISELLQKSPHKKVLLTDIKKFYPSVPKQVLRDKMHSRINMIGNSLWESAIRRFFDSMLDGSRSGIPVGPDMGHLSGHVALEDIDEKMNGFLGECYTRYVDDIIMVCDESTVEKAKSELVNGLKEIGLEINDGKTDVVGAENWLKYCPINGKNETENRFENLIKEIVFYLFCYPEKMDSISTAFRNAGFSFPIRRLKAASEYSRLHRYWYRHWHHLKQLKVFSHTEKSLVENTKNIKSSYMESLKKIRLTAIPKEMTLRRWYIQKCRYYINRLLYLLDFSEYNELFNLIPDIDEFHETQEVIKSLMNENISDLLSIPGRAIAVFSELWSEFKNKVPICDIPLIMSDVTLDSIAILALYRVIEILPQTYNITPELQAFLHFCNGNKPLTRDFKSLSYIDELRSLQLNYTKDELYNFLITRYNDQEGLSLAALKLGETSFSR